MSLITILEKTVSADKAELEAAQQYLEQASQQNLPEFLKQLSEVLKHGGNSPVVRMQAGLQLKNALYSKEPTLQQQYKQRWLLIPEESYRAYIKKNVLETLGTESNRPSSAAQCVAYIACAELPHQMWPELIQVLVRNVTTPGSTEMLREASLEAVGYICQDIEPDVLQPQSNEILTAIVHGMKKEETSAHVRLAATNALLNSLEFTRGNFDIESERHYIMQVVCEATQASDMGIRVAALQCLVKIMSLYYHYMEHYMGPALFAITMEAMKSENDEVALQGIEFWSTVCDEEVDLAIEASDAQEEGRPPERTSRFYAKGALQYLVPILTQMLAKQEEYDDDDEWNPCKAAGVCLMLMATCCEDDIIQHVLPFILEHIKSADWRYRDAAVMAFGCILEGPQQDSLKPLVEQALPTLTELLKDGSVIVRDTAAWTVGRVCEMLPDLVINERFLSPLLLALVEGLLSEPRVAANVCWALSSLAEAAYEVVELSEDQTEPDTYCLSLYFEPIVQRLLETTDRLDGNQNNLRSAAYEALMEFVKNSPKDCYDAVRKTTVIILQRLQGVLSMEGHIASNDRAQYNDLQSLLCATLQSVLRKVTKEDAPQISDPIMEALLRMLSTTGEKAGGVQEDAMLAVSTLVEVLGEAFTKYVEAFKPFLCQALKNYEEYQLCLAAVGVCGDMCRSLGNKILPYCDEIMVLLLEGLGNEMVHRSVKPQILSVFGDLALAIGPEFKKYLEVVLGTLQQATQVTVDKTDFDMVDYLNELRESCLEAYTGIVQGLRGDNKDVINPDVNLIQGHVPYMMQFIELVASDGTLTDTVLSACCGLLGDLCTTFGVIVIPLVDSEAIQSLLVRGRKSKTGKTKLTATWASREIKKIKTAAA